MKLTNKNSIFILVFLAGLFCIIVFNYFMLNYSADDNSKYEVLYDEYQDSVFTKLKMSKKYKFDNFILGTSTEEGLFDFQSPKTAKIIIYGMTYKDFYENMVVFLKVHKETKSMLFPIDIHALMNNDKILEADISKEKFNSIFTMNDYINLYLNLDVTKENIQTVKECIKNAFPRKKQEVKAPTKFYFMNYPKTRLLIKEELPDEIIQKNLYYINKIIDYCQKKNVKITCFIPPYNYIYLNDVFVPKKLEFLYEVEKLIVSKGLNIYDFSIANKYTFERMDKTFLFHDLMHPNWVYGEMLQKTFDNLEEDKSIYRIITANNLDECYEKYKAGLKDYRKTHKSYIEEFKTYSCDPDSEDEDCLRKLELSEVPEEYK